MLDDTIRKKIEHFCAYQERCHEEVRKKLYELRCPYEDIDEYISHLIENDFLNEMRFSEQYVSGKFNIKKWGKRKIIYNLKQKKISDYCIKKAIKTIDEDAYIETLQKLIHKKESEINSKNPLLKKKKLHDYLFQKGYESDIIRQYI